MSRNVLGDKLQACGTEPLTGFFRTGLCDTCKEDAGMHTICARMTKEFLEFSAAHGNDLSSPSPENRFPGLKPGDYWCLCLKRWIQAYHAGVAPQVRLEATHVSVLEYIDLELLQACRV